MQVKLEKKDGLKRELSITVPGEKIDVQVTERLEKIKKTAKIDGFRPGKVPAAELKKRYGESVRHEVLQDVIQSSLIEAIEQEKLKPAGQPEVDIKTFEAGKPLEYVAIFENYPELSVVDLKDQKIEQVSAEVTDADVEAMLKKLQQQHAEWEEVDRPAEEGDQVYIDFEGFVNKVAFEGGKANDMPIILGSHQMIEGFEEGIVGAKKDADFEIKTTFPKDYFSEDLAGKKAVFKIKVNKISKPNSPKLDDAFAERLGIKEGGIVQLREDIKKRLTDELHDSIKVKNKAVVFDKLLELNQFDIPRALIDSEIDSMIQQAQQHFSQQTGSKTLPDIPRSNFEDQAKRRVALGLLLGEIVRKEDIKPDQDRVRDIIRDMLKNYGEPEKILEWYMADKQRLAQFEIVALEDQVVEDLLKAAKVTSKTISLEDAMKPVKEK